MEDFMKDAANVLLGWVLGVGGAALAGWRKDRKRRRAVRVAISRELRETAHRLLCLVHTLEERFGRIDRALLEWMLPQIERYAGPNPKEGMFTGVAGLLRGTDAELAALSAHLKKTTPPQFIPKEELAYTAGALPELHELEPDYVVRILDVLAHVRMINDAYDNGAYYTRLTFTPDLTSQNHTLALENASHAERNVARRARIVVDKITEIELRFPAQ